MRKILIVVVALVVFSAFAKIILYTDKPNSVPVNSDFFSLQRNSDYISASVAQVKGDWFNNPVFTGNGSINGSFTANNYFGDGSSLTGIASSSTVSNIVIAFSQNNTNFTLLIGANGTNFTLLIGANDTNYVNQVSNQLYQSISSTTNGGQFILSNNGNGTNTTNWGVSTFQEVDAQNFFPTNLFTGHTNAVLLKTDANGLLSTTDFTVATNEVTRQINSGTNIYTPLGGALSGLESGTNLSYIMGTNNGGGNAIVAGAPGTGLVCILTNITADTTLKAFTFWTAGLSVVPVYVSCSGGANKQLKFPSNFQGAGALYGVDLNTTGVTITNTEASWFEVRCIYGVKTNVFQQYTK